MYPPFWLLVTVVAAQPSRPVFSPVRLALSSEPSIASLNFSLFELSPSVPVATVDYGHEVAGYPFLDVESVSGTVRIEIKYSEQFSGLYEKFSDGPVVYASSLANTYRVETLEINRPGRIDDFLLQGGQRWQSIRLLTNGSISFRDVGFVPSVLDIDRSKPPRSFSSNNEQINEIWRLGAKATALSCLEKGSQGNAWEISHEGALVRGMKPALTSRGAFLENYTLRFKAKIQKGGFAWAIAQPLASPAKGIQLYLSGSQQNDSVFVNGNDTRLPRNSIVLGYGFSLVNLTTLTSYYLDTFNLPFEVEEDTWNDVETILTNTGYMAVSINGQQVFNKSLNDYYIGGQAIPTSGSFGFGGWQDQVSLITDVQVFDTANGSLLYENDLTDDSVLSEYGVHSNTASVCLDGPKRDRLVWIGDFYHTVRILGASNGHSSAAKGTLQWVLDWQNKEGLIPYASPIGYSPETARDAYAYGGGGQLKGYPVWEIILPDYQILGLLSFCEYVRISGDVGFAEATWPQWQLLASWILNQTSPTTGLPTLIGGFLGPGDGSSAISCATVHTLQSLAHVAEAVLDTQSANKYRTAAETMARNINDRLWNADLGAYAISESYPVDYSIAGTGFCILAGVANSTQAASSITALEKLKVEVGYLDSTLVNASGPDTTISPNTNGLLLEAFACQNASAATQSLLDSLWMRMITNNETYTGASWEYLSTSGDPGLGLFTSLGHPWGGAPTYVLPEYVTGVRTAMGVEGFGYKRWTFKPELGLDMGLVEASSEIMTVFGQPIRASWKLAGKTLSVVVDAPNGTTGTFQIGETTRMLAGAFTHNFDVEL
ncbi:glycoside hydrolase family 78 protein [Pestalotiopsis sp. NC0098]|nr:glycoside hydrolase family 78 protein [Pestalotiopsis sp. NC0098]